MSKYGLNKYGAFKYGEHGTSEYYNAHLVATATDYATTSLSWTGITPDPADDSPTHWALVRSFLGAVDNPENGEVVDGGVYSVFRTSYVDENISYTRYNSEVIYSFWVFNPTTGWKFCGKSSDIVVGDTGSLSKITKWIPRAWLNTSYGVGDSQGEVEDSNRLTQHLSAYAFEYDKLRSQVSVLENTSNPIYAHTSLLPHFVTDYGFSYEPSLGDTYHSTLYRVGNIVNSLKGTEEGITAYVTALTHLSSKLVYGHNLFLDYNDASFEESIGNWTASSGTLVRKTYVTPNTQPTPYGTDSSYPLRAVGYASLTTAATTAVTISLPGNSHSPITYGVPVLPSTQYIFSGWVKHLTNAASVTAQIKWYNEIGGYISQTTISPTYTTTSSWTEFVSKSDSGRNGQLSPTYAAYATVFLTVTPSSGSSSEYVFDMFQFTTADNSLAYEDARLITVELEGNASNYLLNPSFEGGSGFWTPYNGSLIQNSLVSSADVKSGTYTGQFTSTANGRAGIVSHWINIDTKQNYVFSAYVAGTTGRTLRARMEFSHHPSTSANMYANVTAVSGTGSVVTYTGTNTFAVGQTVVITDFDPVEYNITGPITAASPTSFSVAGTATGTLNLSGSAYVTLSQADTILTDANGEYFSNDVYYVEAEPVTMDGTLKRITVIGTSPSHTKDSGLPLAKVSLYFDNNVAGDVYYIDAASLQDGVTELTYFDGVQGILPTDPLTQPYFYPGDCFWEKKTRTNFVSNPSFEDTTNWTAGSGTTLTSETPGSYTALFGSNSGKVAYTTNGSITATVYLPSTAIGGEDVVVSAYVRNAAGTYTIGTNPGGTAPTSTTFAVASGLKAQWIRVHNTRQLQAGETSFTFSLAISGSSETYFHVDGAQAEYGATPTGFIDPTIASEITVIPNPSHTATNIYTTRKPSIYGGKSIYVNNYNTKFNRLNDTLSLVMPIGSTWQVVAGYPSVTTPDLTDSLIPSASFEKDLGSWVAESSTLSRVVSKGTIFGEYVTQGQAYCKVVTTHVSGTASFGIKTSSVPVKAGHGYYASVAVRPDNANTYGTYTLTVTFYTATGAVATYGGTPTDAIFTHTLSTVNTTSRWANLSVMCPSNTTGAASYAVVEVVYQPSSFDASQAFHVDRAVFRE